MLRLLHRQLATTKMTTLLRLCRPCDRLRLPDRWRRLSPQPTPHRECLCRHRHPSTVARWPVLRRGRRRPISRMKSITDVSRASWPERRRTLTRSLSPEPTGHEWQPDFPSQCDVPACARLGSGQKVSGRRPLRLRTLADRARFRRTYTSGNTTGGGVGFSA